jgi:hypothetical protein
MEIVLVLLSMIALGALAMIVILIFLFFAGGVQQPASHGVRQELGGMDEGDYHSGPYGYSPNTAYPETQYGSMFNDEADWNENNF